MAHRSPARLSPSEGRKFALTLAAAFGVLAGLTWWRGGSTVPTVLGGIAAAFALAALLVPGRLGPVYTGWMGLARAISKVTTPIFMGVVYLLVITPAGLIRRLVGGNPLHAGRQPSTAWVDRGRATRGDLNRQF